MGLVFDGDAFGIAFYMSGDGCRVRTQAARSPVGCERATVTGRNGRVLLVTCGFPPAHDYMYQYMC